MNRKGNVMISLLFFLMALGVLAVFITPIVAFTDLMQQSDSLNCKGFIFGGDASNALSFNNTLHGGASGNPLACLSLKLYLPYIMLAFLIAGVTAVLGGRAGDWFGGAGDQQQY